jgi:hypothetical protein
MNKNNKIQIKEATSDGGSKGSYVGPLQPGIRKFKKSEMGPFTIPVSKYDSPVLEFDSYDGSMDEPKKQIKKLESKAKKITNYMSKHPEQNDEDGGVLNQTPGKNKKIVPIKENTTANSAGEYNGPIELGLKKWRNSELFPFINQSSHKTNKKSKGKNVKNNVNRVVGMWEKGVDGRYNIDTHDVHTVKEWFEVTNDTILEDIVPNGLKTTSNYERVIDKFRKDIPEDKMKEYNLIADKIKDFVQDRGYVVKIINACNTGFRGVRTNKAIILCSPESFPNFATFVYLLFHELRHEQQMDEFDLKDSYMGDVEDFEEFFKIYWEMELDADKYGKDWVKKIGDVLQLPEKVYNLDPMIQNYPSMSNMVKQFTLHLHREIQTLKSRGMDYSDISDLDIVKKHLKTLEDMF